MRSIVCLKYQPEGEGLQINPADEAALAYTQYEKCEDENSAVTAITMGPPALEREMAYLRGYGVDRPVLLTDKFLAGADTYATALALKSAILVLGEFDVILCGRRGAGGETGQVPAELAALLGIPCITNVLRVTKTGEGLLCERLLETGTETLEVSLPAVLSLCEYSYPLRKPKLSLLRKAKGKTAEVLTCEDLHLSKEECGLQVSKTTVIRTKVREQRRNAAQLTKEEAATLLQKYRTGE